MSYLEEKQDTCRLRFPQLGIIDLTESETTEAATLQEEPNNHSPTICSQVSRPNIFEPFLQPVKRSSDFVYQCISVVLNLLSEGWLQLTYPVRRYLYRKRQKWGRNVGYHAKRTYNNLETMMRQYIAVPVIAWLFKILILRHNNDVYAGQKLEQTVESKRYPIVSRRIFISSYKGLVLAYNILVYRFQFIQTLHYWHQYTTAWIIEVMEVSSVLVALVETITQIAAVYADMVLLVADCLRLISQALVYLKNIFWLIDTGLYLLNQMTMRLRVEM